MRVYLGLGTNLGDKEKNLRRAIQMIEKQVGSIISLSAFYATSPWGFESGNTFLNAAVCVETRLSPRDILLRTQQIEKEMGRTTKSVDGMYVDRYIDIDLLMVGGMVIQEDDLIVPHPFMHRRLFVIEPLAEIAPHLVHPILGETMQELFKKSKLDNSL